MCQTLPGYFTHISFKAQVDLQSLLIDEKPGLGRCSDLFKATSNLKLKLAA
jgi:hypothetical protein